MPKQRLYQDIRKVGTGRLLFPPTPEGSAKPKITWSATENTPMIRLLQEILDELKNISAKLK